MCKKMSIVVDNNQVSTGILQRSKIPSFKSSPILDSGDRTVMRVVVKDERENGHQLDHSCSSSSSSIGINSDDDDDHDHDEDNNEEIEVQSKLNNKPFDAAVNALEQALPIRRGISKFYNGKSKSFASLTEAACSSMNEIVKPENPYSRKRKNLLAYNLLYDKSRSPLLKTKGIGGGIIKRPTNSSRSTLALAVAMNNRESSIDENEPSLETNERFNTGHFTVTPHPWRSFSVADLQHCAVSASVVKCNMMEKRNKSDEVS